MILEETQLVRGGAPTAQASGPGLALVHSTVPWGALPLPHQPVFLQGTAEDKTGRNHVPSAPGNCGSRLVPSLGQVPPCPSQMISSAQLSQAVPLFSAPPALPGWGG